MEISRGWGEKGVSEEGQQRRMGAATEEKRSQVRSEKPKEEGASEDRKGAAGTQNDRFHGLLGEGFQGQRGEAGDSQERQLLENFCYKGQT